MHARHYAPTFGRFLQPDPARADANLYAYAENSPVAKADPSGRFVQVIIAIILAVFRVAPRIIAFLQRAGPLIVEGSGCHSANARV
jgi:hypothetical protein